MTGVLIEWVISCSKKTKVGRKREYNAQDMIVFETAVWLYGTLEAAEVNLADPENWRWLREAVAAAHPDCPHWRLSRKPPNRDKHYRFRDKKVSDATLEMVRNLIKKAAIEADVDIGMLDPQGRNSMTRPELFMVADSTFVKALFNTPHWVVAKGDTDKKRSDPDAHAFNRNDGKMDGSVGYHIVYLSARSPYGNERIIFDIDFADAQLSDIEPDPDFNPNNEGTIATRLHLDLIREYHKELAGVRGLAYDMALRSIDADRLLDAGQIPLTKIPYTTKGGPAEKNLGSMKFRTRTGNKATFKVFAINGTPGIVLPDGNGELWFFPLQRIQTKKKRRKKFSKFAVEGIWAIRDYTQNAKTAAKPASPETADSQDSPQSEENAGNGTAAKVSAAFPNLANFEGATTTITHNSSRSEREGRRHTRRTLALRPIPESDPWFRRKFGLREDAESIFSGVKADLHDRRCRTATKSSVHLNHLVYQLKSIVTALIAHHKRTGADITKWFGQYQLPERLRPDP